MEQNTNPQVFISYSWDSKFHKEKVNRFVQNLRSCGIDVIYDEDVKFGERLQLFMEQSISNSNYVLFIVTPNYKYRADNRISGVGFENQIITSDLFETYNEGKYIPVLFDGDWNTSLPTWAKGKKGANLSSPEFYATDFPKLVSHLQNSISSIDLSENTLYHTETKVSTNENSLDGPHPTKKIIEKLKAPFNPNTFLGLLLVTVIGGVIVSILQPFISPSSNFDKSISDSSSTYGNTIINESIKSGIATIPAILYDAIDNLNPSDTTSNDTVPYDDTIPNGTMPKGTKPITVSSIDEPKEKLAVLQDLAVGNSRKWIEDNLGAPYAEKTMPLKDGRLLRPAEEENSKTGDILVCVYNISYIAAVQVYFDTSDNSCQGFFVTLLQDVLDTEISLPRLYSHLVSNKSLGEFTFLEIGDTPIYTYGFSSQGDARTFYGEEHYWGALSNYRTLYFAVLDYGMLSSRDDFILFTSRVQLDIAPAIDTVEFPLPDALIFQRDKFYPNTYGISTLDTNLTFDLITDYWWFDSLSLRAQEELTL